MKKEYVMWLIIAVLVVGLLLGTQKAETMAIRFTGASYQRVDFGAISAMPNLQGLTNKSISFWVYQTAYTSNCSSIILYDDTSPYAAERWTVILNYDVANGKVLFIESFSTTDGWWITNSADVPTGGWYNVIITYNHSDVANNPIIYVNGASVAITESKTPVGTAFVETDSELAIGASSFGTALTGTITGARIYNRILTADEVLAIYNARGRDNIRNGLVFCPFLKGAAGLQAFDGATLAAGNTIVDPCSGAVGVPTGSPVGVGETYLR